MSHHRRARWPTGGEVPAPAAGPHPEVVAEEVEALGLGSAIDDARALAMILVAEAIDDNDPLALLTEAEAARLLKFTPRFLQARRVRGDGPKFLKISARAVRYRRIDLLEWERSLVRTSTSDRGMEAP